MQERVLSAVLPSLRVFFFRGEGVHLSPTFTVWYVVRAPVKRSACRPDPIAVQITHISFERILTHLFA